MIQRILPSLLLTFALCLFTATKASANPPPKPVHHHTVIEAVSADSITITSAAGTKTFKITKSTEITFKNQNVTPDKLEAGMRVNVTPDAVDETVAGQIAANDPPKAEASPSPKK